jgi:hypothetical protein
MIIIEGIISSKEIHILKEKYSQNYNISIKQNIDNTFSFFATKK